MKNTFISVSVLMTVALWSFANAKDAEQTNPFAKFFGEWTLKNDQWRPDADGSIIKIPNHHTDCAPSNTNNSVFCVVETPSLRGHIMWSFNADSKVVHHLSNFGQARNGVGVGRFDKEGGLYLQVHFQGEPEGSHRQYRYRWVSDNEYILESTQFKKEQPTGSFYGGTFVRITGGKES